jgi:hypothetical protein
MSQVTTKWIALNAVTNAQLAQMPALTIKGNNAGSTMNASDLSVAQVQAMLSIPTASSPLGASAGGTGQSSLTLNNVILGNGTGAVQFVAPGSSGNVLTSNGTTWTSSPAGASGANTALSNLSAVAINTSLLPGVTNSISLGSSSFAYSNLFVSDINDSSGLVAINVNNRYLIDASANLKLDWSASNGIQINGYTITNSGTPVNPSDLVPKSYVDNFINATSWKTAVLVATTANITLTGEQAIDGVTTSASRVLVKNQSTASQNGIYVSAAGAWSRSSDMNTWAEVPAAAVFVESGTVNADLGFVCTSQPGGTIGTTAITFVQFSSAGAYSADGVTLQLLSGVFSVKNAGITETQIASSALLSTGALSGGSGTKLSVNVDGSSIDINGSDQLEIKAAGVTLAKMASNSVDENKIVSTAFSSTGAITGGSGTKIAVQVDGTTMTINGSDQLASLKPVSFAYTLTSTDITNQYVDLITGNGFPSSNPAYGTSASVNSVNMNVVSGPQQQKTQDYTVSLTGGAASSTRISFANGLATGGVSALVAGDIIVVDYSYL